MDKEEGKEEEEEEKGEGRLISSLVSAPTEGQEGEGASTRRGACRAAVARRSVCSWLLLMLLLLIL